MKFKAYHSRGQNPISLMGLVLAWFFFTTTVMADAEVSENPLPLLGIAENSPSSFAGGISVEGASPLKSVTAEVMDYLDMLGQITVAPAHIDEVVDILVYGNHQPLPPSETEPFYFMLDAFGNALPWEQDLTALVPFQNAIPLKPIQSVPIYRGHLTTPSSLNIAFAYRLSDDTLVSSPAMLQATIKPTNYATFDVWTGLMHIPAIEVPNGSGGVDIYQADLILANAESAVPPLFNPPPSFQLQKATLVEGEIKAVHASYDLELGTVQLEGVYILGLSETQSFSETLTRDPETELFTVSSRTQLPYFQGISQLPTIAFDTLKLTWPPVTSSAEGEISYEIHLSEEANFEPTDDTLYATIVGETEYELTDLAMGTTHYILVIAVDEQGNRSLERDYYAFDTQNPPQPAGFSSQPAPGEVVNFYNSFVNRPGVAQFIKVTETGEMPLMVDFVGITGQHANDFQMIEPEFPFTIEDGGQEETIKVQCFASDLNLRTATLQLSTNDSSLPKVDYTLECKGVPLHTRLDYNSTPIYHSTPAPGSTIVFNEFGNADTIASQTITISERGYVDLTMSNYTITGDHANDFSLASPTFPVTIDGGETQTITVQCSPSYAGLRTAQLEINNNDPKQAVVQYNLECMNDNSTGVFRSIADCAPTRGTVPLTVKFRSRSQFSDGSVVLYRWDFEGDGDFDTSDAVARDIDFTFQQAGSYDSVLEVTNNLNEITRSSCTIVALGNNPTAIVNATPSNGQAPLTVDFTCQGTDADGSIASYEWDFEGDGIFDFNSPTTGNTTYTYSTPGTFNALCRVTDNDGMTGDASTINTVIRPGPPGSPSVEATPMLTKGNAPLEISFTGNATDDGNIVNWEWDFDGNGTFDFSSPTSPEANFTYTNHGTFAAILRVTDDAGLTSMDNVEIVVGVDIALSIANETFDPIRGETIAIDTSMSANMPVRLRIKDKNEGQVVRTLVNEIRSAGDYSDLWDGRDDAGQMLSQGAYYVVMEYNDVNGNDFDFDLTNTTGSLRYNPHRSNIPKEFSPFAGQPLTINFTLEQASEVTAFIGRYNVDTRLITFMERLPLGKGSHQLVWNGENANGQLIHPPAGGRFLFGIWGYTLSDNAIFLHNGAHLSNFSVAPSIFDPTGHIDDQGTPEQSQLTFELSNQANVELVVSNVETGKTVAQRAFTELAAGPHTVSWDGRDDNGLIVAAGRYRLGIMAIDDTGFRSLRLYALQRIYY